MTRRRRLVVVLLPILFVVGVLLFEGARRRTTYVARREIQASLSLLNGAPVDIGSVRLGWGSLSARDIRCQEPDTDGETWLTIDRADAELSMWNLFRGNGRPDTLRFSDARIRLRYDQHGRLQTRLNRLPTNPRLPSDRIVLTQGRLTIEQEGRAPFVADQIDLQLVKGNDDLRVTGQIGDLLGRPCRAEMRTVLATLRTDIRVTAPRGRFTTDQIAALPFVPVDLLSHVRSDVMTSVSLQLVVRPDDRLHYRLELGVAQLQFELPGRELPFEHGHGDIVLEDGVATTDGFQIGFAGGQLDVDATARLKETPVHIEIDGRISDLEVGRLPPGWQVPAGVRGRLRGQAHLAMDTSESLFQLEGAGKGTLEPAMLWGFEARPVQIDVQIERPQAVAAPGPWRPAGRARIDVAFDKIALRRLAERLRGLAGGLTERMEGRLSLQGRVEVPLATAWEPASYRGRIAGRADRLVVDGQPVGDLRAEAHYADGQLTIGSVRFDASGGGQVEAVATARLVPPGDVTVDLQLKRLPLSLFPSERWRARQSIRGHVSGQFELVVPTLRWQELQAWRGEGTIHSPELLVVGQSLRHAYAKLRIEAGEVAAEDVEATWSGSRIRGEASGRFVAPYAWDARWNIPRLDVGKLVAGVVDRSLPKLQGNVDVSGKIGGSLRPFSWQAEGDAANGHFTIAGRQLEMLALRWHANADNWRLVDAQLKVLGGAVRAEVSGTWENPESPRFEVTVRELSAEKIVAAIRDLPSVAELPLPASIHGRLSGRIAGRLGRRLGDAVVDVRVDAPRIELDDLLIDAVTAHGKLNGRLADVTCDAAVMGGHLVLSGSGTLDLFRPSAEPIKGHLRLTSIAMGRLAHWSGIVRRRSDMAGRLGADVDFTFDHESARFAADGQIRLRDVAYRHHQLVPRARLAVDVEGRDVRLRLIEAHVAGGRATGESTFRFGGAAAGEFTLDVRRASARRLLAPWPSVARVVRGAVDLQLRGRLGRMARGIARLRISTAQVAHVPVDLVDGRFDWTVSLNGGRGRVWSRDAEILVQGGRLRSAIDLAWQDHLSLKVKTHIEALPLKAIARSSDLMSPGIDGRIDGEATLQGRNIRSVDDLTGSFQLSLGRANVISLPIFDDVIEAILIGELSSPGVGSGTIEGRLARSRILIERMTIEGAAIQFMIDGAVTLGGRLDLNATVDIGTLSPHMVALRMLGSPLGFLTRRMIFLHVGGTMRQPVIEPRLLDQLEQELAISVFR